MSAASPALAFFAEPWCATHPLTAHDRAVMTQVRAMAEPQKGQMRGVAARPTFDALIQHTTAPDGVTWRADRVGGVHGWWCEPVSAPADVAILHLHGGWFNWGSAEAYHHIVGRSPAARVRRPSSPIIGWRPSIPSLRGRTTPGPALMGSWTSAFGRSR